MSFSDLLEAVGRAYLDLLAIDEIAQADRAGVKPPRTYDTRAPALEDLGGMLIRTYERFHQVNTREGVTGTYERFTLGPRDDLRDDYVGTTGSTFDTEAYRWFGLVIRALVPDIRDSEIMAAAIKARSTADLEDKGAVSRSAYALAVFCIVTGSAIPATPDEQEVCSTFLAGWLSGWR